MEETMLDPDPDLQHCSNAIFYAGGAQPLHKAAGGACSPSGQAHQVGSTQTSCDSRQAAHLLGPLRVKLGSPSQTVVS